MAKLDIHELNYITCGRRQNTFNITYCYTDDGHISQSMSNRPILSALRTTTFFGDIGEYATMSQKYNSNKCSFYDIGNEIVVHNMYDKAKTPLRSTAKKFSQQPGLRENIDLYVPPTSSDFINVCQFQNYAYGLTEMTIGAPVMLSVVMNDHNPFDISYHCALSNNDIGTSLYQTPSEAAGSSALSYQEAISSAGQLSSSVLSSIFHVKRDLLSVMYNYMVEIPEDTIVNDGYDGYIQCDSAVAKNHLNSQYTMDVNEDFSLSGCRDYCNIGSCGDQLYMTYRDNINYKNNGCVDVISSGLSNSVETISAFQMIPERSSYGYQKVEVVHSWNRYDKQIAVGHKSSMFSLKLIDTGLNESTINEQAKIKLRENVQKNVRALVESIMPANCQLFNIYFDGK